MAAVTRQRPRHGTADEETMSFGKFGDDQRVGDWGRRIHNILEEMLNRSFVQFRDSKCWQPATNVYESEHAYYIGVDLSGMELDEINVECINHTQVIISGQRATPRPPGATVELSVHVMEIDAGTFRRQIDLPHAAEMDAIDATYDKGYLWITLPKSGKP
jgi:HSP20 family protein